MDTYKVTAYSIYSVKPENCHKVITSTYEAEQSQTHLTPQWLMLRDGIRK